MNVFSLFGIYPLLRNGRSIPRVSPYKTDDLCRFYLTVSGVESRWMDLDKEETKFCFWILQDLS